MISRSTVAVVALIVVAGAVVAALLALRSPSAADRHRLDDARVSDLRDMQNAINLYRLRKKALPGTLEGALKELSWQQHPVDPATSAPYEYRRTDDATYALCATFDLGSQLTPPMYGDDPFWAHTSGHQCFSLVSKDSAAGAVFGSR